MNYIIVLLSFLIAPVISIHAEAQITVDTINAANHSLLVNR